MKYTKYIYHNVGTDITNQNYKVQQVSNNRIHIHLEDLQYQFLVINLFNHLFHRLNMINLVTRRDS